MFPKVNNSISDYVRRTSQSVQLLENNYEVKTPLLVRNVLKRIRTDPVESL